MLGYIPNSIAKSLVLNRTRTIGVVVPEITHSFFPEAIRKRVTWEPARMLDAVAELTNMMHRRGYLEGPSFSHGLRPPSPG